MRALGRIEQKGQWMVGLLAAGLLQTVNVQGMLRRRRILPGQSPSNCDRAWKESAVLVSRMLEFTGKSQILAKEMGAKTQEVPPQYPPIQRIRAQFTSCDSDKGCLLTSLSEETMMVQDNSIPIKCDGFYLISIKGYFSQEIDLNLYYRKNLKSLFSLSKVTFVNSVTVAFLAYKDKVYLNVTTHNTSYEDIQVNGGELILIHQNPDGFCVE